MTSLEQMMLKYPIGKEVEIDRFSTTRSAKMVFCENDINYIKLKAGFSYRPITENNFKNQEYTFPLWFSWMEIRQKKIKVCGYAIYPDKILLIDEYDRVCEPYERILN